MRKALGNSRYAKMYLAAVSDLWESAYFVKSSEIRARRTAKKEAKRAMRRAEREIIAEFE